MTWEEGKTPDVVIELLSDSTAEVDKGEKKQIYQNQLRVPEYFWFDPFDPEDWGGFQLQQGIYQPIPVTPPGQLISRILSLSLVRWRGVYKSVETTWLRWADLDGQVLPTAEERERGRADHYQQQAERYAQRLRELGIDPDEI